MPSGSMSVCIQTTSYVCSSYHVCDMAHVWQTSSTRNRNSMGRNNDSKTVLRCGVVYISVIGGLLSDSNGDF